MRGLFSLSASLLLSVSLVGNALAENTVPASQPVTSYQAPQAGAPATADPTLTGNVQMIQQAQPVQAMQMPQQAQPMQAGQPVMLTAQDYLAIQAQPGQSKHDITQFTLQIQNKQPRHVEMLQVEVLNGMTEEAFLQLQQHKSQAKRRVAGGILRGVTGVATSFIPFAGIGSYAAYQAIGAGTTAAYTMANVVENSGGAGADYSGRILQRASNIIVSPNQQFTCLAAVPASQQPIVKVIFKDLQTNQIFELQK